MNEKMAKSHFFKLWQRDKGHHLGFQVALAIILKSVTKTVPVFCKIDYNWVQYSSKCMSSKKYFTTCAYSFHSKYEKAFHKTKYNFTFAVLQL